MSGKFLVQIENYKDDMITVKSSLPGSLKPIETYANVAHFRKNDIWKSNNQNSISFVSIYQIKNMNCSSLLIATFVKYNNTEELMLKVERVMIDLEGDHKKAMNKLRVPPTNIEQDYPVAIVRFAGIGLGLFLGILGFLLYIILTNHYEGIKLRNENETRRRRRF